MKQLSIVLSILQRLSRTKVSSQVHRSEAITGASMCSETNQNQSIKQIRLLDPHAQQPSCNGQADVPSSLSAVSLLFP